MINDIDNIKAFKIKYFIYNQKVIYIIISSPTDTFARTHNARIQTHIHTRSIIIHAYELHSVISE